MAERRATATSRLRGTRAPGADPAKTPADWTLRLPTPAGFQFDATVRSHGWCQLAPFRLDEPKRLLWRTLRVRDGATYLCVVRAAASGLAVRGWGGRIDASGRRQIRAQVRHMFRLDLDLQPFYAAVRGDPEFGWVARRGGGRLLRSPDPFEDLVKLLCTTNCTWRQTRAMVDALVARGDAAPGGRVFPTAAQLARLPESVYRSEVRAGYRTRALRELGERVESGDLDLWTLLRQPAAEVRRVLSSVYGAGPYVIEQMLRLLGHADVLALDSWCRQKFAELHHGGRRVRDRTIERRYARWGRWRGLAMWCDLTRDWFESSGTTRRGTG